MRKRSELFFSFILVPLDFLALVAAFVTAFILRVKIDGRPVAHPISAMHFLEIALIVLPIWILIFSFTGLYNLSNLRGRLTEVGKVFAAVSGGVMVLILLDFFTSAQTQLFPSKSVPIYAYGFGLLYVLVARIMMRLIQRYLFRFGVGVHRVLLVGSGDLAVRMAADIMTPRSGFMLIGAMDKSRGAAKRLPGITVYKSLNEALPYIDGQVDQILQADSAYDPEEIFEVVTYATNHQLTYRFVPNQFGLYATNSTFGNLAGIPVLEIRLTPLDGWGRIVKRIFDIVGATVGLIVLSPVFLMVALLIAINDPGPVLYKHRRLSRVGRALYIYKFRSMRQVFSTDPAYAGKTPPQIFRALGKPDLAKEFERNQKVTHDPRVSRIGRFLRASSLDELPQLLNVLAGDLSLVGPRPIVPAELERYGDNGAAHLFALKPGITGLWQISGRSDIGYDERVKLDIYYVENWTLWLDIKILLRTIVTVMHRGGAY